MRRARAILIYDLSAAGTIAAAPPRPVIGCRNEDEHVSEYRNALQAWLSSRSAPNGSGAMPESFRITPALKKSPAHIAALDRVREWTRARFNLPDDNAMLVAEVACGLPGCPPLETVVAFWTGADTRHQFKIFKRVEEVAEDDLPPAFMKNALIVDEESGFECC
jgi:nitrate reductase delta subunit